MDAKQAAELVRQYFEVSLNTSAFLLEPVKIKFDEDDNIWNVEVIVRPVYGGENKYKILIEDKTGEILDVKQMLLKDNAK